MKKKILNILVLPKMAGSQKICWEILNKLEETEFEKWVLFSDFSKNDRERKECQQAFEGIGAHVIFSPKMKREICWSDWGAMLEIYKLCRKEKFDIVHTHSTKPGIIGRIAATLAGVPLVVHTVHGLAFHKYVKFPKWQFYWVCEMFASLFCDKIILVNRYYNRYFRWFKRKVETVYNGVDFSLLPESEKQNNVIPKILFVGRLDEQKDPLTLLQAAEYVAKKYPEIQFTLVGDGEKFRECQCFIEQHNLTDTVFLAGWQKNVASFYLTHDIFVAPSIYESFGLMFVEAGFYGLPVVATRVEGIPEVVEDQVSGLLCSPRKPQELAENIIRLVENRSLCCSMGATAHQRVTSLFSSQKMTERYKKIYNENCSNWR